VSLALGGFDQFGDDVLRGRLIGIAHAKIDDVLATGASLAFRSLTILKT
jgi:hypothetical protein